MALLGIQQSARRICRGPWLVPTVVAACILVATFAVSPNFRDASGPAAAPYGGDFLQEWLGGYIVTRGDYGRFYDVAYVQALQHDAALVGFEWEESRYLPIVYPPFYYLLISPLSYLPVPAAAAIWAGLMVGCLVAAVGLMVRQGWSDENLRNLLPWLLPAALLFMPTLESLTSCQKGPLCLLILTATYGLLARGQNFAAGMVFGLLAFKPQLTLVIAVAMLLKQQWRFVAGGATTGSVLVGLCFLLGTDVCRQYFEFSTGAAEYIHTGGYDLTKSHCWYGFFTLLDGGSASWWVRPATLVASLLTIALLARLLQGKLNATNPAFAVQYSVLILATVLLSPHLFTYDLMILLLPLFLLGRQRSGAGEGSLPQAVGGFLVAIFVAAGFSSTVAGATGVQLVPLLIAGLMFALARTQGRSSVSLGNAARPNGRGREPFAVESLPSNNAYHRN